MTLMNMRDAMLRRSAARSTLLLLAIVVTLLAGLLAMRTLASGVGNHDGDSSASMAMEGTHGSDLGMRVPPGTVVAGCSGTCDPGHLMATMACILALLVATLAALSARSANRMMLLARPAQHHGAFAVANSREAAPPPDLTVLSISRT